MSLKEIELIERVRELEEENKQLAEKIQITSTSDNGYIDMLRERVEALKERVRALEDVAEKAQEFADADDYNGPRIARNLLLRALAALEAKKGKP